VVIDETESEEESQLVEQSGEPEGTEEGSDDSEDDIVRPPARSTKKKPLGISSDTEDEEEELDDSVHSLARITKKKTQAIPSESEDDDEELEQRALSPSTRMSITGVRVADFSDGDSEIEYSDEKQETPRAAATEDLVPRYTTHFAGNIQETLHSTIGAADPEPLNDSSGSDVLILSNRETPIEVLSSTDEEASHNKENMSGPPFMRPSRSYSPRSSAGAPVVKTTKNLSQPTIQAALKQRTSPGAPRRSRVKSEDQKVVSQVVYEEEIRKLAEKRVQLSDAEKLFEKVAHKLPDRGSQIKKRIDVLRQELERVTQYVSELKVEPSKVPAIKVVKPAFKAPIAPSVDGPDWDELSAAVHQIQPVYTGAQGMATFNNQKALTLESLKVG